MKSTFFQLCIAVAALSMMATGCKKDDGGVVTLSAELENVGNDKVHMGGTNSNLPMWDNNDEVWINGTKGTITLSGGNASVLVPAGAGSAPYYAVYPHSAVTADDGTDMTITLPATQTYEEVGGVQKINMPMVAKNDGQALKFRNLCSLFKVTVTNSFTEDITLYGVKLTAATATVKLSGTMSIARTDIDNQLTTAISQALDASGSNEVTLSGMSKTVTASSTVDVYIVVPVTTVNSKMNVTIYTSKGQQTKNGSTTAQMPRNTIAKTTYTTNTSASSWDSWAPVSTDIHALTGEFTVDGSGTKVHFSNANAYCSRENSSSKVWTWHTYPNQLTCQVNMQGHSTVTTHATDTNISLFRFRLLTPNTYDPTDNAWRGNFGVDFGTTFEGSWFTLSGAQWAYLINSRTGDRFARAVVAGNPGLILFPDGFDATGFSGVNNTGSGLFSVNDITAGNWETYETQGCVFLPYTGYRYSSSIFNTYAIYASYEADNINVNFNESKICQSLGNANSSAIRLVTLAN